MKTVRIVHFADLHLGVEAGGRVDPASGHNVRVCDMLARLDELCEVVEAESVDVVLFAGDAFKHQHPTPTLQKLFAERMRRIARSGAVIFLLVGNHDLPKMEALAHPFSIYEALDVPNVVVGDAALVYRLALRDGLTLQVAALPHFSRQRVVARLGDFNPDNVEDEIQRAVSERVKALGDAIDRDLPAVFCGHCHVNQADVGAGQSMFGLSELEITMSSLLSTDAFPYFALGHIHKHQVLRREPFVVYPGSLERVDFGEGAMVRVERGKVSVRAAEPKGFYRFDLQESDGKWQLAAPPQFYEVSAREFYTIHIDADGADDPTDAVLAVIPVVKEALGDLSGAMLKVVVHLDPSDRARLTVRRVQDAIPEAESVIVMVQTTSPDTKIRDPRFAHRMGEAEALERYLETKQEWADERQELLDLGRALIAEVTK